MEVQTRKAGLADLQLTDYGKLLVFLYMAERGKLAIPTTHLEPMVFLINGTGIMSFCYHFRLSPFPKVTS